MQAISRFITVNGLKLHYLDWGSAAAPPVVCVHGYTSSAEAFNALAQHFQDRCRIITPDVRGHGASAWSPNAAYQYRDQVGDLAALVSNATKARNDLNWRPKIADLTEIIRTAWAWHRRQGGSASQPKYMIKA